ncbi:MAG: hypothetical protein ACLFWL_16960 [Candidatus Brocadiia bacterium]
MNPIERLGRGAASGTTMGPVSDVKGDGIAGLDGPIRHHALNVSITLRINGNVQPGIGVGLQPDESLPLWIINLGQREPEREAEDKGVVLVDGGVLKTNRDRKRPPLTGPHFVQPTGCYNIV